MKKFILISTILSVLFLAIPARAQSSSSLTVASTNVAGLSTNVYAMVSKRVGPEAVTVFCNYTATNAVATGSVVFEFGRSLDNTNWTYMDPSTLVTNTITPLTTNVSVMAMIKMEGAQYLRLNSIQVRTTGATQDVSSVNVKYQIVKMP